MACLLLGFVLANDCGSDLNVDELGEQGEERRACRMSFCFPAEQTRRGRCALLNSTDQQRASRLPPSLGTVEDARHDIPAALL
jgi:hypothetical protein